MDLLQARRNIPRKAYLFEARPGSPIRNTGLCLAVSKHHAKLGAKEVHAWGRSTPHDLRRKMRTGLSAYNVRPDIAELTIGHVKTGIVAVYGQHGFDHERREAMMVWKSV